VSCVLGGAPRADGRIRHSRRFTDWELRSSRRFSIESSQIEEVRGLKRGSEGSTTQSSAEGTKARITLRCARASSAVISIHDPRSKAEMKAGSKSS